MSQISTQQTYNQQKWEALLDRTVVKIKELAKIKGGEYAGGQDRLANFRRNGKALGLPMEIIWAVYAGKHWDAIQQFVQDLNTGKERIRAEPIEGRVDDLIVYLILFKAMLEERNLSQPGSITMFKYQAGYTNWGTESGITSP